MGSFHDASLNTQDRVNNVEMIRIPASSLQSNASSFTNITINVRAHRLETKSQVFDILFVQRIDLLSYRHGCV